MTIDQFDRLAQNLFLCVYYSTPVLRGSKRIPLSPALRNLPMKEPTDSILLILEMVCDHAGFCFQGELEDLVCYWFDLKTSSSFDKSIALLDEKKCISKERNPSNKRQNRLRITPKGRRLCEATRAIRTSALRPLLKVIANESPDTKKDLQTLLAALSDCAYTLMIDNMRDRKTNRG